jgi:hypothetical protein
MTLTKRVVRVVHLGLVIKGLRRLRPIRASRHTSLQPGSSHSTKAIKKFIGPTVKDDTLEALKEI